MVEVGGVGVVIYVFVLCGRWGGLRYDEGVV